MFGIGTTRGWKEKTVLRVAPSLFGMYTVVTCLYLHLPKKYAKIRGLCWSGKAQVTISDALTAVRLWLWKEWIFSGPGCDGVLKQMAPQYREFILNALNVAG